VLSPVLGHYTWLEVDHGEGSWLVTRAGRRVLDLTSGIAVTPVGHAHPRVVEAVQAQVAKLSHICAGVAAYEPNIALAETLTRITPPGLDMVLFCNAGAEAFEPSLKLSRQRTRHDPVHAVRAGATSRRASARSWCSTRCSRAWAVRVRGSPRSGLGSRPTS